jgi:hypothetical protein
MPSAWPATTRREGLSGQTATAFTNRVDVQVVYTVLRSLVCGGWLSRLRFPIWTRLRANEDESCDAISAELIWRGIEVHPCGHAGGVDRCLSVTDQPSPWTTGTGSRFARNYR